MRPAAGLSFFEARSHFASWAIVSSPLTLSLDVNNDTVMDAVWDIIANKARVEVRLKRSRFDVCYMSKAWPFHPLNLLGKHATAFA